MAFQLPPIVKLAQRLLVDIDNAVQRFTRYHKYECGSELRKVARQVLRLSQRAWRDRNNMHDWTGKLVTAMDDLKMELQLCLQLKAMSFAQFEHLGRTAIQLGKQIGGWHKQRQHLKGQNATSPAASATPQRAQTLSTCAASNGAMR